MLPLLFMQDRKQVYFTDDDLALFQRQVRAGANPDLLTLTLTPTLPLKACCRCTASAARTLRPHRRRRLSSRLSSHRWRRSRRTAPRYQIQKKW